MSTMFRPLIARNISHLPSTFLPRLPRSSRNVRSFSVAARRSIEAGRTSQASTAIMNDVRVRDEKRGDVVGGDMKGAEGAHYQGMQAGD